MSGATLSVDRDQAEELTVTILEELFSGIGGRAFNIRLWTGRVLEADGADDRPFTLVLTHPGSLRRMLIPPGELTLAEAYLRGDFDVEGDIVALMGQAEKFATLGLRDWVSLLRQASALPKTDPPERFESGRQPLQLSGQRHSKARDEQAVTYHYDTGNDFYALFLGHWMAYSCAYFPTLTTDRPWRSSQSRILGLSRCRF